MGLKVLFGIFLIFSSLKLYAQEYLKYPVQFRQFFNSPQLINPAALTFYDYKMQINSGRQMYEGAFSLISTFYVNANFNLSKQDARRKNIIGFTFINDKEGPSIEMKNANALYALNLPISESWVLSAGAHIGFVNLSIDQTATSPGVSSFAPDASLGMVLVGKDVKFGVSGAQLFNSKLEVISNRLILARHFNFFFQGNILAGLDLTIVPSALIRLKRDFKPDMDYNLNFLIKRIFLVGSSYGYLRGLSYHIGFNQFKFLKGLTNLTFSYNSPTLSSSNANLQTFEISFNYNLVDKKEEELIDARARR